MRIFCIYTGRPKIQHQAPPPQLLNKSRWRLTILRILLGQIKRLLGLPNFEDPFLERGKRPKVYKDRVELLNHPVSTHNLGKIMRESKAGCISNAKHTSLNITVQ